MVKLPFIKNNYTIFILGIFILIGLYLASIYNYLLFHSLSEIFSIVIACGIFMFSWNAREVMENDFLLFLGVAYLFVGGMDLVHTLSYKGMGVFQGYGANLPTQLWISARYLESFSLLIAPLWFNRKLKINYIVCSYFLISIVLLLSLFYWNIFPDCFVEGVGLTPFKKLSEYVISLILIGSIVLLSQKRAEFDESVYQLLVASIILTILAEIAFTFYVSVYGLSNLFGHYFKIISFFLLYKAIISAGLKKPYGILFKNLKQSEKTLRKSEERYRSLFEDSPISLWEEDFSDVKIYIESLRDSGVKDLRRYFENHPEATARCSALVKVVGVNKATLKLYDAGSIEEFREGLCTVFGEDSYDVFREELIALADGDTSFESEAITRTLKGDKNHINLRWSVAPGYEETVSKVLVSIMDISERKQAEEQIKASLKEKEVLLGEIHHRVKNNMQVIISLLRLQAGKIEDKKYVDIFKEGEDQIRSMALIHEQLYQTKDLANINLREYIKTLSKELFTSHGVDPNKIKLNMEIEDIAFDLETAIPCGLIINELVSNSLKHAFPQDDRTRQIKLWKSPGSGKCLPMNISIDLRAINENDLELTVSDDGIGMPEELDISNADSMGLSLVSTLTEHQLDGKITLNRAQGTQFNIKFKRAEYKPRI